MKTANPRRSGFTLIELLVVVTIVVIVSAAVLPTITDSWSTRRIRDASALVHSTLNMTQALAQGSGARRAGVRLLPAEGVELVRVLGADGRPDPNGPIDPSQPLAYSRMVPLVFPADYQEGVVMIRPNDPMPPNMIAWGMNPANNPFIPSFRTLMIEEAVFDEVPVKRPDGTMQYQGTRNNPTSWFWNVRIGDKITVSGHTFTVCGPLTVPIGPGNVEGFVNVGLPGTTTSPLIRSPNPNPDGVSWPAEFLLVTNGLDDDDNGYVDDGWDGLDNDLDSPSGVGALQRPDTINILQAMNGTDEPDEREVEQWPKNMNVDGVKNGPYAISRKPYPDMAKVVQLPSSVVIDASGWDEQPVVVTAFPYTWTDAQGNVQRGWLDDWGDAHKEQDPWDYTRIRSRLPVDPLTGYSDLIFDAAGEVGTTGYYRNGMPAAFGERTFRLWIGGVEDIGVSPSKIAEAYTVTVSRQTGESVAEQFDLDAIKGTPP